MRVLVLLLLAWCAVSALLGTSLAVLSTLTRRRLSAGAHSRVFVPAARR